MTASSSEGSTGRRPGRPGRRPGPTGTRAEVLEAARAQFAGQGFAATTIRGVAQQAGVDASLVMQFFGSKQGLFAAVLQVPEGVLRRFDAVFDGPGEDLGERVVRAFLDVWEGTPADAEPLMVMLRGAMTDELAREQLRDFVQARLLHGIHGRGEPDPGDHDDHDDHHDGRDDDREAVRAALRAGVVSSMLVGLVLGRRVLQVPTLAGADREDLVRLVAPAVHLVLTGR
ncbi:TetR family transcriptional regulator [Pseudokineococcus basanitobsidens]|uniref:TetR family transcriptional regulator n=1 Tax=Pseudokineococcus basanitobsidens TaxID=1926649 RepID=A0ABU8RN29_9ACTN